MSSARTSTSTPSSSDVVAASSASSGAAAIRQLQHCAGDSALPTASTARTSTVCVPGARPVSFSGGVQAAIGAPSSEQSKRATVEPPESSALASIVASREPLTAGGP